MPVDGKLLEILCCPVTKIPVKMLGKDKLAELNRLVEAGSVRYADGATVDKKLGEGLVTENGTTVYRVDDGIPVMLEEQAIPTAPLDGL